MQFFACRCWDERRSFLSGTIHIDRDFLTVPVELFLRICLVVNINAYLATFFEAK